MRFNFTKDDIDRGKLVNPGEWYTVEVESYKPAKAKTDGSNLDKFTYKILEGEFAGVKLYGQFSEKAAGFVIPFAEAITGEKIQEGDEFSVGQNCVGKIIQCYVVRTEYNNKPQNTVENYRPVPTE